MSVFGGFSSFPRRTAQEGGPNPLLGPVDNNVQGFTQSTRDMAYPGAVKKSEPKSAVPPPLTKLTPQIAWSGILNGYSGYAKANREISKRVVKWVKVGLTQEMVWDPKDRTPENMQLFNLLKGQQIDPRAPQVTFYPPRSEQRPGYRVIYTMMETEVVHPNMIHLMNAQYHECWVPTQWNANTFKKSGLTLPVRVMPLGIDPNIYHPDVDPMMPKALRLTGETAGKYETPSGFLFIYLCQPSFRKGIEVVIEAFGRAFKDDPGAGLVIASTAHSASMFTPDSQVPSKIWLLDVAYSERDLASIYRACKAYVCASRGEGWNLPMMEAAAVGIPVIVPRTSAHPDLVPEDQGFFFSPDQVRVFPSAKQVSAWFENIGFPDFGEKSIEEFVQILRMVKQGYRSAREVGLRYMQTVRTKYTWDVAAANVVKRVNELCSG